jgi:hypothetical protein
VLGLGVQHEWLQEPQHWVVGLLAVLMSALVGVVRERPAAGLLLLLARWRSLWLWVLHLKRLQGELVARGVRSIALPLSRPCNLEEAVVGRIGLVG